MAAIERLKWVRVCLTCDGNGFVEGDEWEDEDGSGVLWVCPNCNGSGEEPRSGEYGGRRGT